MYDGKVQTPAEADKHWATVNQTIDDLIKITQNNSNLTNNQKAQFVHDFRDIKSLFHSNVEEARKRLNQTNLQIQLQQAQNALKSGFQTQEANKNLKAAEGILNELKNNIADEKLKKSFEKITQEMFWANAGLEGVHYLNMVEKVVKEWKLVNAVEDWLDKNLDNAVEDWLGKKLDNIVHTAQNQYIQDRLKKIEAEKKELIDLGNKVFLYTKYSNNGKRQFYTVYGNPSNDPTVMLLDEQKYKLKHLFDEK